MFWNQWLESLSLVDRTNSIQSELPQSQNRHRRFLGESIEDSNRELQAIVDLQQGIAVCTSPADGAEISALAVHDDARWHELLYRANDFTKVESWPGRAPWLWPIAGRCYATSSTGEPARQENECTWQWNGAIRTITRHGLARHQAWRAFAPVVTADKATSVAELRSDSNHREAYPFEYHLMSGQQLSDDGLEISFRVAASAQNLGRMPFALGLHFTFNFSSWWGVDWLQGSAEGLGRCAWHADNRAQASERFELPSDSIRLSDAAFKSAIVPARANAPVRLVSPDSDRALEMSFAETSGVGDGDLVWVSFIDPQHRFFCLEPWVGWPNAINSGRGRVELQPGESWEFRLRLGVKAPHSSWN